MRHFMPDGRQRDGTGLHSFRPFLSLSIRRKATPGMFPEGAERVSVNTCVTVTYNIIQTTIGTIRS